MSWTVDRRGNATAGVTAFKWGEASRKSYSLRLVRTGDVWDFGALERQTGIPVKVRSRVRGMARRGVPSR